MDRRFGTFPKRAAAAKVLCVGSGYDHNYNGAGHRLAAEAQAQLWRQWILRLHDQETGVIDTGDELLFLAQTALARGEREPALELLAEARELKPVDAEGALAACLRAGTGQEPGAGCRVFP